MTIQHIFPDYLKTKRKKNFWNNIKKASNKWIEKTIKIKKYQNFFKIYNGIFN